MAKRISKRQRAAQLRAKAARLEAEALEADDDFEDGDCEADEDDEQYGVATSSGGGALSGPVSAENLVGGLGGLARMLGEKFIEDSTSKDANGQSFKFARRAGSVKNVQLDGNGNVVGVNYKPEEWPPRGEGF